MTKIYPPVVPSRLADHLNQAFASGDPHKISSAIGQALNGFNRAEIAKKTGLQRPTLYRAFGSEKLPNFSTVLAVLTEMGLQLKVEPRRGDRKRAAAQPTADT